MNKTKPVKRTTAKRTYKDAQQETREKLKPVFIWDSKNKGTLDLGIRKYKKLSTGFIDTFKQNAWNSVKTKTENL